MTPTGAGAGLTAGWNGVPARGSSRTQAMSRQWGTLFSLIGKMTESKTMWGLEKWGAKYDGKFYSGNIIKAYRKKFAVDRMEAVRELQLLGVSLTKEQIDKEKAVVKAN